MAKRFRRTRRVASRAITVVRQAPARVVQAVRNPRRTFRAIRQSKTGIAVADVLMDNILEAAGGTTSAMIDAYVGMTGSKTDDEYAPIVKGLAANGLKFVSKYKGGRALRTFATALSGHNYGEWLSRKALEAFKTPAK